MALTEVILKRKLSIGGDSVTGSRGFNIDDFNSDGLPSVQLYAEFPIGRYWYMNNTGNLGAGKVIGASLAFIDAPAQVGLAQVAAYDIEYIKATKSGATGADLAFGTVHYSSLVTADIEWTFENGYDIFYARQTEENVTTGEIDPTLEATVQAPVQVPSLVFTFTRTESHIGYFDAIYPTGPLVPWQSNRVGGWDQNAPTNYKSQYRKVQSLMASLNNVTFLGANPKTWLFLGATAVPDGRVAYGGSPTQAWRTHRVTYRFLYKPYGFQIAGTAFYAHYWMHPEKLQWHRLNKTTSFSGLELKWPGGVTFL